MSEKNTWLVTVHRTLILQTEDKDLVQNVETALAHLEELTFADCQVEKFEIEYCGVSEDSLQFWANKR